MNRKRSFQEFSKSSRFSMSGQLPIPNTKGLRLLCCLFVVLACTAKGQKPKKGCALNPQELRTAVVVTRICPIYDADSNIIGDDSCYQKYTLLNSSKDSIRFVCNGKVRKTEFTIYNRKGEHLFHATDTTTYWKYNETGSTGPRTPIYPSGVYY